MQMHGGIAFAAALGRDDLDQVAHGRRIDRPQEGELIFRHHDIPPFCIGTNTAFLPIPEL
jgi:hypothetical protein